MKVAFYGSLALSFHRYDLSRSGECFALSHNKFGKMVSLELIESDKECFEDYRCYTNGRSDHSFTDFHCDGDGSFFCFVKSISKLRLKIIYEFQLIVTDVTRGGAIMCNLDEIGYYPSAFYTNKKGLCAFNKIFPIKTLEAYYGAIQFVISKSVYTYYFILGESVTKIKIFFILKIIKTDTASLNTSHQCAAVDIDAYLVLV